MNYPIFIMRNYLPIWSHKLSPRKILQLDLNANTLLYKKSLKQAYYKLSQEYHPDHLQKYSESERDRRKQHYLLIQEAYSFLKNNPNFENLVENSQSGKEFYQAQSGEANDRVFTGYQKERPEFKKSFQAFGLGVLFLFTLNLIMTRKVKKRIDRTKEMGWMIHNENNSSWKDVKK